VVKLLQAHPGGTGPLVVGETFLDKLEVRALLGKGGHAWVYECFDRFLQRPVAVKVIKTLREAGRDLSRRAQAEARVLAGMQHPNLVRVIDAGMLGGLVYIVMEKLEGRTLRHTLISLSRLSIRESLELAIQIADGMQLAHDSGVIHRDLKPENIFIETGNHVKVLDFGVAKVLGASQMTTQKDRVQGTVFYMSPEQLQGVAVTPASDVFALGTMLFEMLYGHPLTLGGGVLPNNEHVAWMQLYQVPPPLETLDANIPRYVGKLVGRAIVKLPKDRYQTMREFREAAVAALRRYEKEQAPIENPPAPRELSGTPPRALVALPLTPAGEHETPKIVEEPKADAQKPREVNASERKPTVFGGQRVSAEATSAEPAREAATKSPRALFLGFLAGSLLIALVLALRSHVARPQKSAAALSVVQRPNDHATLTTSGTIPRVDPLPATPEPVTSLAAPTPPAIPAAHTATLPVRRHARNPLNVSSGLAERAEARARPSTVAKPAQAKTRETIF
jgi:serine/threonine protein kinase